MLSADAIPNIFDDGVELVFLREVDQIRAVFALHRSVRGDDHHFETIDLLKLVRFGISRTRHAGQLLIHAEEVLKGDRGDRLVLFANLDTLFRLNGLMQPIRPTAARHRSTGKLIDNDDFAIADDIFHVLMVQTMSPQSRIQMMHDPDMR